MSTKVLFRIMIAFALLAVIFAAVQAVSSSSALAPEEAEAIIDPRLSGSDWIERHASNYYAGSDWIERYTGRYSLGVVAANYYAGSDYIERHPAAAKSTNLTGSDWIERHPSNYYSGSDWIERH